MAYRFHYDGSSSLSLNELDRSRGNAVSASLGVAQVWVSEACRRQGIAARLLDAARANHLIGLEGTAGLGIDKVAFSQPTRYGRVFAERYVTNARVKDKVDADSDSDSENKRGYFLVY